MTRKFQSIVETERFRFIGNVELNKHVSLDELRDAYDKVVLCFGSAGDNELNIDGASKSGNLITARSFVGWYNSHPHFPSLSVKLDRYDTAIIIGNGNVALDIARILLKSPQSLESTDISEKAISELKKSKINHVRIVSRRGPMNASFSTKELRECVNIAQLRLNLTQNEFETHLHPSKREMRLNKPYKRLMALLSKSAYASEQSNANLSKTLSMDFFLSPHSLLTSERNNNGILRCEITKPIDDTVIDQKVAGTEKYVNQPRGLIISSIGFKNVLFDERIKLNATGGLKNDRGRLDGLVSLIFIVFVYIQIVCILKHLLNYFFCEG